MPTMSSEHARECAAFLKEPRATANARLSAERVGVGLQKFHHRRRTYPDFATDWAAAVAFAEAALLGRGGARPPEGAGVKTLGGECLVTGALNRRAQVKRAPPGRITPAGECKFLEVLAATANVALACDTIGVSDGAIYLRRKASMAFAAEMDAALNIGVERLELSLLEAGAQQLSPDGAALSGWMDAMDFSGPLDRMTHAQAIHLLNLRHKQERRGERPPRVAHNRRRMTLDEARPGIIAKLELLRAKWARAAAREERARGKKEGGG